jgi:hypothetical protein
MRSTQSTDNARWIPNRRLTCAPALALAAVLATGCATDNRVPDEVTVAQCEALREHMLQVRLRSATVTPNAAARHRENLRETSSASIEWCTSHVSANQIRCAMQANSPAALENCLPSTTAVSSAE